jgi:sigma-B regulation protein RsbU (phosphoserine phosphatase)
MKVLIAEDDPVAAKALTKLLAGWGYKTVVAETGTRAWELLRGDVSLSMAVIDWQMPGINGDELCRLARSELPNRPLYLLLITAASTGAEGKVSGLKAGADDYLTKPFDLPEMRARLQVGERVSKLQNELHRRIQELEQAMAQVKQLRGLLPICVHCKKIRDDQNYWHQVETYVTAHTAAEFTHGICPECLEKQLQEYNNSRG